MKKTPGQELYELLNPYDPTACANPAQWHETDEDFQAHYERCALKYHESLRASLANAERRAEDAEARNVFLETEFLALAEKVKK